MNRHATDTADGQARRDEEQRAMALVVRLSAVSLAAIGVMAVAAFADHLTGLGFLSQALAWARGAV